MKQDERLKVIRTTYDKLGELIAALESELAGEATPAQQAKDLVARYVVLWGQRYAGQFYLPSWGKDIASMKRLLKSLAPEAIEARMAEYLRSPDAFYAQSCHAFTVFVGAINKFSGKPAKGLSLFMAPADCRHVPPCKDDVEHTTRRRMGER